MNLRDNLVGKESWPIAIAAAVFLLQFIGTIIAGVRAFAKLEANLRSAINEASKEVDERIERQAREFGEVVSAMRQKIQEVELYGRDHYVSKETFTMLVAELKMGIERLGDRMEEGVRRMEAKIDQG